MSILNWYVLRGFLLAFFMSIGILTFAMTGANLIKVLDLVAEGASAWAFIQFVFYLSKMLRSQWSLSIFSLRGTAPSLVMT